MGIRYPGNERPVTYGNSRIVERDTFLRMGRHMYVVNERGISDYSVANQTLQNAEIVFCLGLSPSGICQSSFDFKAGQTVYLSNKGKNIHKISACKGSANFQFYVNHWSDLERIFDEEFCADVDWNNGRPGTACQPILVIGVLKQGTDCDFDRLQSLADNHALIRAMLGHDDVFDCGGYEMQTLVDNVSLLTPRMPARVGKLPAESGHEVAGKKPGAALRGRVDSFCVETDVHFPTDVNLLMDAVRRMVRETAREACRRGVPAQRQSAHLQAGLRRRQTEKAVREYLWFCRRLVAKTAETFSALMAAGAGALKLCLIDSYLRHAERQIDQVSRRLLRGEVIPQDEKVFSIFEPHTRQLAEGNAGSPVEPVVPMVVVEDQFQFIIHHEIMQ